MNIQINLGLFVISFHFRKRKDTLFIKHKGVRYFVSPQTNRPNRASVFIMGWFSETYICPLGRGDTKTAEAILPRVVFIQAEEFMRERNRSKY